MIYKTISLLQPWASLVVSGKKRIETRSFNTKYRGPLLIHASKRLTNENILLAKVFNKHYGAGLGDVLDLPLGVIIGGVHLIGTQPTERINGAESMELFDQKFLLSEQERAFGDFGPGRYGWMLTNFFALEKPIPAKGSLSLWDFDLPEQFKF